MSATDEIGIVESSGNVFADLGICEPEDALTKAALAHEIGSVVADRRLRQAKAARLLEVDQATLASLLRGHLAEFSIDQLLRFLLALDRDIEIIVKPASPDRSGGRVNVVAIS